MLSTVSAMIPNFLLAMFYVWNGIADLIPSLKQCCLLTALFAPPIGTLIEEPGLCVIDSQ